MCHPLPTDRVSGGRDPGLLTSGDASSPGSRVHYGIHCESWTILIVLRWIDGHEPPVPAAHDGQRVVQAALALGARANVAGAVIVEIPIIDGDAVGFEHGHVRPAVWAGSWRGELAQQE